MRDLQIFKQIINAFFIRCETYEYGVTCIDVIAKNTEIISD